MLSLLQETGGSASFFSLDDLNFLGAFAKLRKASIGFVTPVRPSVRPSVRLSDIPHGTTRLPLDEFLRNLMFEYLFRKSVQKIKVPLKSDKNNGYFT
jgi:hypothetical protein